MNYIWEALLKADKEKIKRNNIKFKKAEICSPYMEMSFEDLNLSLLSEEQEIDVNIYYRFYEIFKELFDINFTENREFRDTLLDIILHYLGELDLKEGICKEEFQKQFLLEDICEGVYGEVLADNIKDFDTKDLNIFLSGLITLYRSGTSIYLFNTVVRNIFRKSVIYRSQDKPKDIYIYLDEVKTKILERKIEAVLDTFLPINMNPFIFWDKHFGIIGIDKSMKLDEIVMVE
ncbi:MAG: hypothetical protein ACI398_08805 [Clostridium sp.]